MEEKNKPNGQKQEKLSYADLQKVAGELSQQNQKMYAQIRQMQEALERREFDYTSFLLSMLFKVVEHPEMYDKEFVQWCVENIKASLTSFVNAMREAGETEEKKADEAK